MTAVDPFNWRIHTHTHTNSRIDVLLIHTLVGTKSMLRDQMSLSNWTTTERHQQLALFIFSLNFSHSYQFLQINTQKNTRRGNNNSDASVQRRQCTERAVENFSPFDSTWIYLAYACIGIGLSTVDCRLLSRQNHFPFFCLLSKWWGLIGNHCVLVYWDRLFCSLESC